MKRKKGIIWVVLVVVLAGSLFVINMLSGNPISKRNAQRDYLQYFETAYGVEFMVYGSTYNPKIPAYIFEIGPEGSGEARFNTALYSMGIADEYGGMLGAAKLSEDIDAVLQTGYGHLSYEVRAKEDPLVAYAGEEPDYFETDPVVRVTKNHYLVDVILPDGSMSEAELSIIEEGMARMVEARLPYETPNLQMDVRFQSDLPAWEAESKEGRGNFILLFSTTD